MWLTEQDCWRLMLLADKGEISEMELLLLSDSHVLVEKYILMSWISPNGHAQLLSIQREGDSNINKQYQQSANATITPSPGTSQHAPWPFCWLCKTLISLGPEAVTLIVVTDSIYLSRNTTSNSISEAAHSSSRKIGNVNTQCFSMTIAQNPDKVVLRTKIERCRKPTT